MSKGEDGLTVEGVSHRYGRTPVLRDAGLRVRPGEIHSLLGPSGSGKTTLLRLVAGLEVLQRGRIAIAGQTVADPQRYVPPESRSIGFVFQDYALFPHLSVRKNILFGLRGVTRSERLQRVETLLGYVGMTEFSAAMPHTLSGGQQQRVALARALASQPSVMLLDEPFSGLDARLRGEVRSMTRQLLHTTGVATLLVTHDPQEALQISDQISVIREGRVEQSGTPSELFFHPQTLHVAEMFGTMNQFASVAEGGKVLTPWGPLPSAPHADGRPLTILVRPESLILEPARLDDRAARPPGVVEGQVVELTLRGDTTAVRLELAGGEELFASVSPYGEWHPGDRVTVRLARDSAILLDG